MIKINKIISVDVEGEEYIKAEPALAKIAELKRQLEMAKEALQFECGNRCAHQNPCNARETLEKLGVKR